MPITSKTVLGIGTKVRLVLVGPNEKVVGSFDYVWGSKKIVPIGAGANGGSIGIKAAGGQLTIKFYKPVPVTKSSGLSMSYVNEAGKMVPITAATRLVQGRIYKFRASHGGVVKDFSYMVGAQGGMKVNNLKSLAITVSPNGTVNFAIKPPSNLKWPIWVGIGVGAAAAVGAGVWASAYLGFVGGFVTGGFGAAVADAFEATLESIVAFFEVA